MVSHEPGCPESVVPAVLVVVLRRNSCRVRVLDHERSGRSHVMDRTTTLDHARAGDLEDALVSVSGSVGCEIEENAVVPDDLRTVLQPEETAVHNSGSVVPGERVDQ